MYKIIYSDENKDAYFDVLGFNSDHSLHLNIEGHFRNDTPVFETFDEAEAFIYDESDIDNYEYIGLHIVALTDAEVMHAMADEVIEVNDSYDLIGLTYSLLEEQDDKTLKAQELMTAILNYTVDLANAEEE